MERIASCVVYLEQDGALVAWEAEGAPRVLVDGDMFFAAHAACGTLEGLEAATDGRHTQYPQADAARTGIQWSALVLYEGV